MHTVLLLNSLVADHQILTFALIYLGLLLEGEFTLIATGVLAHLGAIDIYSALLFILCGGLSKSLFGYLLGGYLRNKLGNNKFFKYIRKRINNLLPGFKAKPFWSIFISKFMIGTNNLAIIFSGYERIDYRKFLKAEISATIIWAPALLLLGYIFGYAALNISREIWKFLAVIIVLYTIFYLFDKLVSWLYELSEEYYDEQQQN